MQPLDYAAIVAYLAITMFIVYRSSRQQDDTEDFFLGNRSMPWFAVGLSIMATLLSTNTYLGAPGEMIKYGPAWVLGFAAYPLVLLVVLYVWIPFFMRLRLTSAYDYLAERYDYRARLLGGLLFLGMRLGWMSMVVFTASKAMVAMLGDSLVPAQPMAGSCPTHLPGDRRRRRRGDDLRLHRRHAGRHLDRRLAGLHAVRRRAGDHLLRDGFGANGRRHLVAGHRQPQRNAAAR